MRWLWSALVLAACGSGSSQSVLPDAGPSTPDSGTPPETMDGGTPPAKLDPFTALPDTSEGLTNVSADLDAILENGTLAGACADWESVPTDRRKMLLCGKWMFFYESFDTAGVPAAIVDFYLSDLGDLVGPGFSAHAMIEDPTSGDRRLPLGLAPGAKLGDIDTLAYTCASCHFGRLPDGRFAVGAPNHDFEYGKQILSLTLVPALLVPGADEADHHPDAIAAVRPILDLLQSDRGLRLRFLGALLPLAGAAGSMPTMTVEEEGYYARWKPGTMDFLIAPLPTADAVHTISKISPLFGLPRTEERETFGMETAQLGWTGVATSLEQFVEGFITIGGAELDPETVERYRPLVEYIYSLRPPDAPSFDAGAAERGAAVFAGAGCSDCHSGPRGSGLVLYDFSEIGTDSAMERWGEGVAFERGEMITNDLKSPRIVSLWAQERFLHNGSLDSLEQLLCLDARPQISEIAFGSQGHEFGCDLSASDRTDLIEFLLSH